MEADPRDQGPLPAAPVSFAGPRVVGVGLLLLGLFVLVQALGIGPSRGYSPVGPNVVPIGVAVGLIVLALVFLARVTVVPDPDLGVRAANEGSRTHWPTVGLLCGVLLLYAFALGLLGYPIATALLVPATARVLGSRAWVRDLLIGAVIGIVVWFGFTQLLGVRLPAGLLDAILPGSG